MRILCILAGLFMSFSLYANDVEKIDMLWDGEPFFCKRDHDANYSKRYACAFNEEDKPHNVGVYTMYSMYIAYQKTNDASNFTDYSEQTFDKITSKSTANIIVPYDNGDVYCYVAPWNNSKIKRYICSSPNGDADDYPSDVVFDEYQKHLALSKKHQPSYAGYSIYAPPAPSYTPPSSYRIYVDDGISPIEKARSRLMSMWPKNQTYHIRGQSINCSTYPNMFGDITYCD